MQFRKDIQGFRALAFLLVFIFHLNHNWLPGGFLGVDIFFVISGYLMTSIIVSDIRLNRFSFYNFFLKRVKRIVPAYYFFVLLVAIAGIYLFSYLDMIGSLRGSLLYTSLFISNILFGLEDNYFGARLNENPFLHTWSLAIEMQFYVVLPILIYVFRKHVVKVFLILILLCSVYSIVNIYMLDNKNIMYFSLIARFPEFLIGGLLSQIFGKGIDFNRNRNSIIAIACLIIIILSCFFITGKSHFPGFLVVFPCLPTALLLSLKNNCISDFFSKRILVFIGELSYSLYLWHFPIIAFLRYRYDDEFLSLPQILLVCILTLFFGWISYRFIESKFRKVKSRSLFIILFSVCFLLAGIYFQIPKFFESKKIPELYSRPFSSNTRKLGDSLRDDKILVIGDSHALMFNPFLDVIGKKNHFSFTFLTTHSYPALPSIKRSEVTENALKYFKQSRAYIKETQDLIDKNQYIILSISGFGTPNSEYKAIDSLAKSLRTEQKLILINSFPMLDKSPLRINNSLKKNSDYKFKITDKTKNLNELRKVERLNNNVFVFNIHKGKIVETPGYLHDTVAYYDRSHINVYASRKMGQEMDKDFMIFFNKIRNEK